MKHSAWHKGENPLHTPSTKEPVQATRETVIASLKRCSDYRKSCFRCPYEGRANCVIHLMQDAIKFLRGE